jgi:DNA-directed RNA polymerase subunit RPC12/RpoP
MITKCPECDREISDQAHTCPHCGFPLLVKKIKTATKTSVTSSIDRISSGALSLKRCGRSIGIHIVKLSAILGLIIALAVVFYFVTSIAVASIQLRIAVNIILPFFWAPVLNVTMRFYGLKPARVLYYISIVLMGVGVLSEYGTLSEASIIYGVTTSQVVYAVFAKIIGLIWYALACIPRVQAIPDGDSTREVTNEHS